MTRPFRYQCDEVARTMGRAPLRDQIAPLAGVALGMALAVILLVLPW